MFKKIFLLAFIMFVPNIVNASVYISEIMYDLEGTDSDREWVEIHNDTVEQIDLSTYYFYENGTAHKITSENNSLLNSGEFGIIVDSIEKFREDWPDFAGLIFDSVFSLSNNGEEISLLDSNKNVLHTIIYNPEIGAKGTGNTLQYFDEIFIPGSPTPGEINVTEPANEKDNNEETTGDDSTEEISVHSSQEDLSNYKPTQKIKIGIGRDRRVLINTPVDFNVFMSEKNSSGKFYWNFGDGKSKKGTEVKHEYKKEGEYNVVLNAFLDGSNLVSRAKIFVDKLNLDIYKKEKSIYIENKGDSEVNIGEFILKVDNKETNIIKDTILSKGQSISFDYDLVTEYSFYYPGGKKYFSSVDKDLEMLCEELKQSSNLICNENKIKDFLLKYRS